MNRRLPFRFVIKSLHISSILMCLSSVSWLYIIFHMKTNISNIKFLPTKIKNYTATSSPNCKLFSTLFCPYLLHPLQICSARSFSDVWLMFLHYINTKQRHIKLVFFFLFSQTQINILFRYIHIHSARSFSTTTPLHLLILHIHFTHS